MNKNTVLLYRKFVQGVGSVNSHRALSIRNAGLLHDG